MVSYIKDTYMIHVMNIHRTEGERRAERGRRMLGGVSACLREKGSEKREGVTREKAMERREGVMREKGRKRREGVGRREKAGRGEGRMGREWVVRRGGAEKGREERGERIEDRG